LAVQVLLPNVASRSLDAGDVAIPGDSSSGRGGFVLLSLSMDALARTVDGGIFGGTIDGAGVK
jgi:hypothetical protein